MRKFAAITAGALGASAVLVGAVAAAPQPAGKPDSGTIHAATTYNSGGSQYAAGNVSDKMFGSGAVTYALKVSAVPNKAGTFNLTSKPVTQWFAGGSLSGTVKATLVVDANANATATGTVSLTKGTGTYKHHSFKGTFSGTGKVGTGVYTFHYTGTYR